MFQPVYFLPLFLCNLLQVQATLPPILEQLHPLHPAPVSPHYHVPEEGYLPTHHLPPPPPPPLQHAAPLVHEVKPIPVERTPVDPARCALIVPDHRPPAHSYINNNYLGYVIAQLIRQLTHSCYCHLEDVSIMRCAVF